MYGVLRPRAGAESLGVKSVDREAALLFLTLTEPAPLPIYVAGLFGADTPRAAARLVADGILQVDVGDGFVCGADAVSLLHAGTQVPGGGRIAALSRDALRYAQALPIDQPWALAKRIYGYNRLPVTPRWHRLLNAEAGHARYLGVAPSGRAATALSRTWSQLSSSGGWISWSARSQKRLVPGAPTYKLYISPTPESLGGDGFATVVSSLASTRALQFKVGSGAAGLLRPDKLVAYFADFESLADGASRVHERLGGLPAHGVPFTAQLDKEGLLSWGVDPPPAGGLPGISAESWRVWLARHLARALIASRATPEPWRFAVERLRLEGIDTDTWTPQSSIFRDG